ncbi:MAG: class I SAM-dependent methyltransferase, partial [Candidatus Geothermincolia bacterium]
SEDYDRIFLENPLYVDTIERMMSKAEASGEVRVLDLGCGTGNVTAAIVRRLSGRQASVLAVDPSAGMREKCLARFAGRGGVEVLEGNALEIPAGDASFDFIFSNLVLHHVPPEKRAECGAELARVLTPGGTLVYADMFCDVDSDPKDPVRVKDIIDKMVGVALYCLDHGAFDMMQIMLATLPADISNEGEYLTTAEVWREALLSAGLEDAVVSPVPPDQFGVKIITARKPPA